MILIEGERNDAMGEFHNQIVALLDNAKLSPPEAIIVLRMIVNDLEKAFEVSVKGIG